MIGLTELEEALRDDADVMRARSGSEVRLNLDDAADAVAQLRELRECARDRVKAAMDVHRRDPDQHDVWLPMIRCMCGLTMMSNRYRDHLADEIAAAVIL